MNKPALSKRVRTFLPEFQQLEERLAPVVQINQGFIGLNRTEGGGLTPPDTIGLITPTHAVEMVNSAVAFYDRNTGTRTFLQDFNTFFQPVRFGTFLFDPICIYDEVAGRSILIVHDRDTTAQRGFFEVAVSNDSNPMNGFTEMFRIEVTEPNLAGTDVVWGDNAKVGQTADAIIISANMFGFNSGFSHTSIISISKSSIYDKNNSTLTYFDVNRAGHFSAIPANMHGSLPGSEAWFVENGNSQSMVVTRMTNVLSAAPTFTDTTITVPTHNNAPAFRQPGGTITSFDQRVLSVAWRNNTLVAAHIVGVGGVARARWYDFNTAGSTPTLNQSGNVNPGSNNLDTYFPAIDIAANGDIGIAYMQSGTTENMSMYVTGRNSYDPLGTLHTGVLAKAGLGTHNSGRAGDYSGISVDPLNPNQFWGFSEYSLATASQWGTWISRFEILPFVVAVADSYSTNEDTQLVVNAPGVLQNDVSNLSLPLTAVLVSSTTNGSLTLNANGSFTYTPNANYFGSDSFVYRATDGTNFSAPVTVTITINPVNDPPVALNDFYLVQGGQTFNAGVPGVLLNDTDIDSPTLQAVWFSGPSHGTLTLNADGSFTYTPNASYSGLDAFQYRAFDGQDYSNVATVTLQVNFVPVAVDDDYLGLLWNQSYQSAFSVLQNDQDFDGDPMTAELVSGPANGTLQFQPNGTFTYTPNNFFFGIDTFTYRVRDPYYTSNVATVRLYVGSAPIAGDDTFTAERSTLLTINPPGVLGNDLNFDGSPMTAEVVSTPLYGELVLHGDGSFTYLPVVNFIGADTFKYRAVSGGRKSNVATVTINVVEQQNRPPIAVDDAYTTARNQQLVVQAPGVLQNDSDPNGDPLTAALVSGTSFGLLGLGPNGSFIYTPNPGYAGVDHFTYRAFDGQYYSNVATVTINVEGTILPPLANNDNYTTEQGQALVVNAPGILGNDSDPQALPLSALLASNVSHGTLSLNSNGSFTYTPNASFTGTDTFTYRASNGVQQSGLATVTIQVTPLIQPPVARDDAYTVVTGQSLVVNAPGVMQNDSDPQSLPLTAQLLTGTGSGLLLFNPNGSFSYTPNLGFTGLDTFTYQVSNGTKTSQVATVRITVQPVLGGPQQIVVVGADAGLEPRVRVYDGKSGVERFSFLAYEPGFTGGVRVATADLNGDGTMDIITAPGAGRSPLVRVFDGVTGNPLAGTLGGFHVFSTTFLGGVFVAVGDINNDGTPDIIASADAGATPSIRSINGKTGAPFLGNVGFFNAYDTTFTGGVRVAVGDVNGDGRPEIITTPGTGGSSLVRVWDVTRVIVQGSPQLIRSFYGFDANYKGGSFITAGDLDGDGKAEIILGTGGSTANQVRIFNQTSNSPISQFTPFGSSYTGGVRVAVGDVNGDGKMDLIAAPASAGLGVPSRVRFYDATTLSEMLGSALTPFSGYGGGLFVGGFRKGL